jgi:transposase
MNKSISMFGHLLQVIPKTEFFTAVKETSSERGAKGFSCWDQFVAMLFCQMGQAKSLREICGGLASCLGKLRHLGISNAPHRSTLSYANEHRPWTLYQKVFYQLLAICRPLSKGKKKFRFKNPLFSLDATIIDLCATLFDWATYRKTKGAVKLHLLLDHEGYLPVFAHLTEGNVHEVNMAKDLSLPAGSIVAMDRGYNDYGLFGKWTAQGVFFVTRLKDNARYRVTEDRAVQERGPVLEDQIIELEGAAARKKCPHRLRRVEVWDAENQRVIVLLTNHLTFASATIAAIYKDRWQIEIFFKTIKQNLKIKTFVGTTANALKIQIWTALIAILLLKYLQFRSRIAWSLSNLVALLRYNLFTYRDLWAWLDDPFDTPPLAPGGEQLALAGV